MAQDWKLVVIFYNHFMVTEQVKNIEMWKFGIGVLKHFGTTCQIPNFFFRNHSTLLWCGNVYSCTHIFCTSYSNIIIWFPDLSGGGGWDQLNCGYGVLSTPTEEGCSLGIITIQYNNILYRIKKSLWVCNSSITIRK